MKCLSIIVSISFFLISFSQTGIAQDVKSLQAELIGKQLYAQLNMPASAEGIDLYPGKEELLDLVSYTNRINQYDVSIKAGASATITKVELEKNTFVIYLGEGGYKPNIESSSNLNKSNNGKSEKQIELEETLALETDPSKIAHIKRELSKLKRNKSIAQGNNRAKAAQLKMIQSEQEKIKARNSGSRIYIKFEEINQIEFTASIIEKIIAPYFTFQ